MKKIIFAILMVVSFYSNAQPLIQWQKCLGGSQSEDESQIQKTTDGGYILSCRSYSNDGDVSGNHGGGDIWVVKLTNQGIIEWQKCLGGSRYEQGRSIRQTSDGGYILTGTATSNDGDVIGIHGLIEDIWVVKLSSLGVIQWQKCLGGSQGENGYTINQTLDGGYILIGRTQSNDGDVSGNHGDYDAWVVKLSSLGLIQWQKCLGGSGIDFVPSLNKTTDGGYIITGRTQSNDGDVSGNHGPNLWSQGDIWVVKLSSLGVIQWQKCLGGSQDEGGYTIQQTTDGGYILNGYSSSNDGDVSGNYGQGDVWVVKLSSLGVIQWQKCIGGSGIDVGYTIHQALDGGYILICRSHSNDGDVSGNHGGGDIWVVKLTNQGIIEWQKCLGGSSYEGVTFASIEQTSDEGYILTGSTQSNGGDVAGNHGMEDTWIVKLSSSLGLEEQPFNNLVSIYPNPVTNILNINVENNMVNQTYTISDVAGKLITEGVLNNNCSSINVEQLSKGIYYLKIAGNNANKFIKE